MSRDLYQSDSDDSVDNDQNENEDQDQSDEENAVFAEDVKPKEKEDMPKEETPEVHTPEVDTPEDDDSPEDEEKEDTPEEDSSDSDDSAPPFEVNEIVQDDERFDDLYKETNLNAFVTKLKDTGLLAEPVQILLACKSKYVEMDVSRDLFGWSKQIKYPSEQYKTFVPGISVQVVNMLSSKDVQQVSDKELIYDGLKGHTDPYDSISFLQLKKGDGTITPPSGEINNMKFAAFTPMVDLVLQNPGYLAVLSENLKLSRAFNFLNASIVKTSAKKQKRIRGKKELVKTFNLRDIVYILESAGAKSVVFYNVVDTFTAEDDVIGELNEDDEMKEADEVSLDFAEPTVYPDELPDEISNVAREDSDLNLENSDVAVEPPVEPEAEPAVEPEVEPEVAPDVEPEVAPSVEPVVDAAPVVEPDEVVTPEPVVEPDEVVTPEPAPGNSVFDDKKGGKYTRTLVKKNRANTRKLRLVHKGHR